MGSRRSGDERSKMLSRRLVRGILEEYLSPLPDGLENSIIKYMELLDLWGRKMPLTSLRDSEEILRFHFGESIFACSLIKGGGVNGRLADVGSGAGFPGLAMKLVERNLSLALIESNRKKCAFLHEVTRTLKLSATEVIADRFGSANIEAGSLEYVTCRALGDHDAVLRWARGKLRPGGSILLWMSREDCSLASKTVGWQWGEPALLPKTRGRYILMGVLDS